MFAADAIAIQNVAEGAAVDVPVRQATGSRRRALAWSTFSGLAEPAGALVGFALLTPFLSTTPLGIMVFICLDGLRPTAVGAGRHHTAIHGLVLGMAAMAVSRELMKQLLSVSSRKAGFLCTETTYPQPPHPAHLTCRVHNARNDDDPNIPPQTNTHPIRKLSAMALITR